MNAGLKTDRFPIQFYSPKQIKRQSYFIYATCFALIYLKPAAKFPFIKFTAIKGYDITPIINCLAINNTLKKCIKIVH